MLLHSTCVGCGAAGTGVCRRCERELDRPGHLPPLPGIDAWSALLAYDDVARAIVLGAKNGQRRDLLPWLAERAVAFEPARGAVVTWAPTSIGRRGRRGYDQAELLARAVARRWGRPVRPLLRRRPGAAQEGRRVVDRWAHPGFDLVRRAPASVVVVDDVATTGATLTAAARALRDGGCSEVRALVAARAPTPVAR